MLKAKGDKITHISVVSYGKNLHRYLKVFWIHIKKHSKPLPQKQVYQGGSGTRVNDLSRFQSQQLFNNKKSSKIAKGDHKEKTCVPEETKRVEI